MLGRRGFLKAIGAGVLGMALACSYEGLSAQKSSGLTLTSESSMKWSKWSNWSTSIDAVLFTTDKQYKQVKFQPRAAEILICVPSGKCRTVFEIAAWMDAQ